MHRIARRIQYWPYMQWDDIMLSNVDRSAVVEVKAMFESQNLIEGRGDPCGEKGSTNIS